VTLFQVGLLVTLGSCHHLDGLELLDYIEAQQRKLCWCSGEDMWGVLVFTPLEKTNNNSSGVEVLSSSLVLAGSRSRAQGTETTLWVWCLIEEWWTIEITSVWARADQQVTDTTWQNSCGLICVPSLNLKFNSSFMLFSFLDLNCLFVTLGCKPR
jgi:hypothetical protein